MTHIRPHEHSYRPQHFHRPVGLAGSGGLTAMGPNNTLRATPPPQEYYCCRIALIGGDPNTNGGRDSQGYYKAFLEGMQFLPPPSGGTFPEVRISSFTPTGGGPPSGKFVPLAADQKVMAYHFAMTAGASTPGDNGLMLLQDATTIGGNQLLGKITTTWMINSAMTVEIWGGAPGSEVDQNYSEFAYNLFGTITVSGSAWVWLANNGFGWYVIATSCP